VFEVRFHGRGGQGVVTAAELLSVAAFYDGAYAQAFPSFGSERTGAPVVSFCRIDERPIRSREPVLAPDAIVIQDATLLHQVDVFGGIKDGTVALINSRHNIDQLGLGEWAAARSRGHIATVAASDLARRYAGSTRANAALLGGLAALTGIVSLGSVMRAIDERLPPGNAAAAEACHQEFQEVTVA
jgi:pyruvate ferredoxin oxidoreductase gamma subunit